MEVQLEPVKSAMASAIAPTHPMSVESFAQRSFVKRINLNAIMALALVGRRSATISTTVSMDQMSLIVENQIKAASKCNQRLHRLTFHLNKHRFSDCKSFDAPTRVSASALH